jgi:purine-nucleoside phosphorylase
LLDGHPAQLVVLPVRLLWLLGCRSLLYTNTVGAINPTMRVGDFVAIRNHINFYATNPLIGEANDEWGERFFDMAYPYERELTAMLHQVALERGITLHEGVYFGTLGPSFETAAEIEMAGRMGADVVGMTTVMEVIAARQLGMRVACFGFVSNLAAGVEVSKGRAARCGCRSVVNSGKGRHNMTCSGRGGVEQSAAEYDIKLEVCG